MGTNVAFISADGIWSEQLIHALSLEPKADTDNIGGGKKSTVLLVEARERKYMICDYDWKIASDEVKLAALSKLCQVYTVGIVDTCNYAEASAWLDGKRLWKISYSQDDGKFDISGTPPDVFSDMKEKFQAHYKIAPDESTTTWCELPKQLFYYHTGYLVDRSSFRGKISKSYKVMDYNS